MVNPGVFKAVRLAFLLAERENYAKAVADGNVVEVLADIIRRYFKRFPMCLGDDYEPLEEELVKVDDQSPDEETSKPDEDKLSAEEFKVQMLAYEKEQGKLKECIAVSHVVYPVT